MLCGILLAALLVRCVFFFGGIRGSDAFAYARYAHDIASGQYDLEGIRMFYGFRYSLLLPTAMGFSLFGVNDIGASFFPLIFSLLNIWVVFLIGKRIFNDAIALVAALLLAFYPINIATSTGLSPDSFIPFFSSLAIYFYLVAEKPSTSAMRAALLLMASGMLVGLAYMSRVTSIFLFFTLVIYQIFNRKYAFSCWTTIGSLIPLTAEVFYFYMMTGDPLFEIHRITSPEIVSTVKNDYDTGLLFYPKRMLGFELEGLAYYGMGWWFVIGGLALSWFKKDKGMVFIAFCLILPFLGFEFGFQSLKEGTLIAKSCTYLSLMIAPIMLIGAYFIVHAYQIASVPYEKRIVIVLMMAIVLMSMNLYAVYRFQANGRNDAQPYKVVADYLRERPGAVVYTHHYRWPLFLGYFLQYDRSYQFKDLNDISERDFSALSHVYVIFSKRYLEADVIGRALKRDRYYYRYAVVQPKHWTKVLSFSGKPVYNSVDVFYIKSP